MSGSTHFAIVQAVAYELPENNEKWDFNHIIDDGDKVLGIDFTAIGDWASVPEDNCWEYEVKESGVDCALNDEDMKELKQRLTTLNGSSTNGATTCLFIYKTTYHTDPWTGEVDGEGGIYRFVSMRELVNT